ncbi:MAG: hypothetical protein QGI46_11495 [Planctomycetota bacterium]|nr:hypothetical protein [Planctomycetota bacterium]
MNSVLALALASLCGSGIAGVWAVCMVTWTLPETDGAHGQAPFASPAVYPVLGVFVFGAWILTLAASSLCLRRADLGVSSRSSSPLPWSRSRRRLRSGVV